MLGREAVHTLGFGFTYRSIRSWLRPQMDSLQLWLQEPLGEKPHQTTRRPKTITVRCKPKSLQLGTTYNDVCLKSIRPMTIQDEIKIIIMKTGKRIGIDKTLHKNELRI